MKLEEATSNNICEYSLTGKFFRVKLLGRMKCNRFYATFAVEIDQDTIFKAYVHGESASSKKVGKIFYVKFGRQKNMDDLTRIYSYCVCDENGNTDYTDDFFKLDYENYFTHEYTAEYIAANLPDDSTSDDES